MPVLANVLFTLTTWKFLAHMSNDSGDMRSVNATKEQRKSVLICSKAEVICLDRNDAIARMQRDAKMAHPPIANCLIRVGFALIIHATCILPRRLPCLIMRHHRIGLIFTKYITQFKRFPFNSHQHQIPTAFDLNGNMCQTNSISFDFKYVKDHRVHLYLRINALHVCTNRPF